MDKVLIGVAILLGLYLMGRIVTRGALDEIERYFQKQIKSHKNRKNNGTETEK